MYLLPCLLALTLLTECSSGSVLPHKASPLASSKEEINHVMIEGLYSNYDYAYSVSVPQGLVGCREPAPFPNHGFGIDLTGNSCGWMGPAKNGVYPKSYLYVDASYDSLEWGSPDDAIKAHMNYLKGKGAKNLSLEQHSPTQLSTLPAMRFVLRYDISGEAAVEEMVVAVREGKDADIVYTIDLLTDASRYSADEKVLSEMRKTWGIQPLP